MLNFRLGTSVGIIVFCLLSACAQAPVQSFRSYAQTFETAKTKGNEILDKVAEGKQKAEQIKKELDGGDTDSTAPFPAEFNVKQILATELAEPASVTARRNAFNVVADYNVILLGLAEGRSVNELQGSLSTLKNNALSLAGLVSVSTISFAKALSAVAGPVGPAVSALMPIIRAAEKARSQAEFKEKFLKGYDNVLAIIIFLIDDTRAMYEIVYRPIKDGLVVLEGEIPKKRNKVENIAAESKAPTSVPDIEAVGAFKLQYNEALKNAALKTTQPVLPFSDSGPDYSSSVTDKLNVELEQLQKFAAQRLQAIKDINDFYTRLVDYAKLLDQVRQHLILLKKAVEAPPDVTAGLLELVRLSYETGTRLNLKQGTASAESAQ